MHARTTHHVQHPFHPATSRPRSCRIHREPCHSPCIGRTVPSHHTSRSHRHPDPCAARGTSPRRSQAPHRPPRRAEVRRVYRTLQPAKISQCDDHGYRRPLTNTHSVIISGRLGAAHRVDVMSRMHTGVEGRAQRGESAARKVRHGKFSVEKDYPTFVPTKLCPRSTAILSRASHCTCRSASIVPLRLHGQLRAQAHDVLRRTSVGYHCIRRLNADIFRSQERPQTSIGQSEGSSGCRRG